VCREERHDAAPRAATHQSSNSWRSLSCLANSRSMSHCCRRLAHLERSPTQQQHWRPFRSASELGDTRTNNCGRILDPMLLPEGILGLRVGQAATSRLDLCGHVQLLRLAPQPIQPPCAATTHLYVSNCIGTTRLPWPRARSRKRTRSAHMRAPRWSRGTCTGGATGHSTYPLRPDG